MKYNIKSILYKAAALSILVFTVAFSFIPSVAVWGMVVSVSLFSAITLTNPYPGKSIRGKRLFSFQAQMKTKARVIYIIFGGLNAK